MHTLNPHLVNTLLWVMQGFLAVTFLIAGSAKVRLAPAKVAQLVPGRFPLSFLRTLGALEILGAIGIVLPWLLQLLPVLTAVSAACMAMVLLAATVVHLKTGEFSKLPMLVLLLALAMMVLLGRFGMMEG